MSRGRSRWLLVLGTGDAPLAREVDPERLRAHSSTRRPAIQRGDLGVCYAAVWQTIFAVVEVAGDPDFDPTRARWGWRFPLRPLLVLRDLDLAPPVQSAGVFPHSLGRHSYVRLTAETFEAARAALEDAGAEAVAALREGAESPHVRDARVAVAPLGSEAGARGRRPPGGPVSRARETRTPTMIDDPKRVVAAGYDAIADRFAAWQRTVRGSARDRYLDELLRRLPPEPDVLELGCGAGVRSTRKLAERGRLVGVDISEVQLRRARERAPSATFTHADMTRVRFEPESFDAVVSLFALAHVPRAELPALVERIAHWLRPGGRFLATMGARGAGEAVEPDWLGVPMFFSSVHADESRRLVGAAGLAIELDEIVTQHEPGHGDVAFLWVLARKPE